jgi:hypothetical protein
MMHHWCGYYACKQNFSLDLIHRCNAHFAFVPEVVSALLTAAAYTNSLMRRPFHMAVNCRSLLSARMVQVDIGFQKIIVTFWRKGGIIYSISIGSQSFDYLVSGFNDGGPGCFIFPPPGRFADIWTRTRSTAASFSTRKSFPGVGITCFYSCFSRIETSSSHSGLTKVDPIVDALSTNPSLLPALNHLIFEPWSREPI